MGAFGTGATNFCAGNDARLSDARTPASHTTGSHSDWPAAVSMTELGYLDGVTSAVQTQINTRVPMLTAALNLYVATTGNDSNPGTSGSPFLTIQKAIDVAVGYHLSIYNITIAIADGTYDTDTAIILKSYATGGGIIILSGSLTTPANCVLTNTSSSYSGKVIVAVASGTYRLEGLKLVCDASGQMGIEASGPTTFLYLRKLDFGLASLAHIRATAGAVISSYDGYTISGNVTAGYHLDVREGAVAIGTGQITLTNTPSWSSAFVFADIGGKAKLNSFTFSGSSTGKRYEARAGGIIATFGGADFLPGNSAGSVASGGIYA